MQQAETGDAISIPKDPFPGNLPQHKNYSYLIYYFVNRNFIMDAFCVVVVTRLVLHPKGLY
jgi:hypothetical protein